MRSCYRCGAEFPNADQERICADCRKPKTSRRMLESRELTFREKQIVQWVAKGKLNKEIAFVLHLSEGTVKEYMSRIFRKLAMKNRTELAMWFLTQQEN